MVIFEILTISIGIIYGYAKPGKEDRAALFKKGLLIGIAIALVFVVLGALLGWGTLLIKEGVIVGAVIFISVIIFVMLFIVGTLFGDWLEEKSKGKTA